MGLLMALSPRAMRISTHSQTRTFRDNNSRLKIIVEVISITLIPREGESVCQIKKRREPGGSHLTGSNST